MVFKKIILTTINAKWIHPSLALRLLKANLGSLEDSCEIIEFALRQPLHEKLEQLLAALADDSRAAENVAVSIKGNIVGSINENSVESESKRILGISVSIWNHIATLELLKALEQTWSENQAEKPIIVLGGPEATHLPPESEIFFFADYVIRGEGEIAFRSLCESILSGDKRFSCIDAQSPTGSGQPSFIDARSGAALDEIKTAYHLYTDEDVAKKLIYVESSRGCPFGCEFCLSAADKTVREFPLEPFLAEMDTLIQRGAKTFKFLDRSFNTNIKRSLRIIEFFLNKIKQQSSSCSSRLCEKNVQNIVVHFEMVPSIFPAQLREILTRFPPGTLRLEIGIQTLNEEAAARVGRPSNPEKELEALHFLREETNAVIHADLIAGLPGEDFASFGRGFDRLLRTLIETKNGKINQFEIQVGILKLLPGAVIYRHNEMFGMRYNMLPPYEIEETSSISTTDLRRIKNFARFWELIVNRGLLKITKKLSFRRFMSLSDELLKHFGKNWGIDKKELQNEIKIKTVTLFFLS